MINNNYNNIINNAKWYNTILSTKKVGLNSNIVISNIKDHLTDCKNYPTLALVARQSATAKNRDSLTFIKNESDLKRNMYYAFINEEIDDKLYKLYPKTKSLRLQLIKNERITLDKVVPKLKDNTEKFLIKLKSIL